ncbi:PiggyBac transposable element-derived protein 3 [Trichinella papuae]|uniref:PiggyBac transposable element-derived protein 3 n=1 Tax=Trichinella papuae TaxID=268474 RepID=A0A0V1MFB3_9BILA|nr:PiggyBac transposable element-derived protein 3 [Trichinella papuae]
MVPYYGHHSCKMFIRGKPIRFGYKIWTMASANGYPYALKIYGVLERPESFGKILTTSLHPMIFLRSLQGKRYEQREPSGTKKDRGFFDHICNGIVYLCKWNDNTIVTMASNHLTHRPVGSVQRYSQAQKKHIKIRVPEIVRRYNTSMGGVDTLDKLLSSYRPPEI